VFLFAVGASRGDLRARASALLAGDLTEYRQREIVATAVEVS
jgi:hypothetical protein